MYSQLQKLAILCNCCFWATVIFRVWEKARVIPQAILNTVVVLGISAIAVNITVLVMGWYYRRHAKPVAVAAWAKWVILLSTVCQLAWLVYHWRIYLL